MVKNMLEAGWFDFARAELQAGRNPGKKSWQRVLCAGLLSGGITRDALRLAYETELSMTPGSAKVRASKAIATFQAGGLLIERNGRLVLNPN